MHADNAPALAWEELYIAEGSDWNWWYGNEHSSANDEDFDALFRHLEKVRFSWVTEIWSGHVNHGAGTHHALCCLEKYGHMSAL